VSWRDVLLRLRAVLAPRRVERDLDDELTFHVEMATRKHMAKGMPEAEARVRARARFGPAALAADACRDVRGTTAVAGLGRDFTYAWRTLRRSPLSTALIVATLALGLGLVGAVFNPLSAFALHADAVSDREGLFALEPGENRFTLPDLQALRDGTTVFSALSARLLDISSRVDGRMMHGALVSGTFFTVAGVDAVLGRTLTPADDGAAPGRAVLVLSDRAWRRHFQRDPAVIGRRLTINDVSYEVVGVTPPGFRGLDLFASDFWAPLAGLGQIRPIHAGREDRVAVGIVGRLAPGVSRAQAQAALAVWASRHRPSATGRVDPAAIRLEPLGGAVGVTLGGFARLLPLFVPFTLVLVVGCANVANLLLARAVTRQRELGIRLAIGASRSRVVRQLLIESALLTLVAAACAVGVTRAIVVGITSALHRTLPPELLELATFEAPPLDGFVVLFIVASAFVAAAGFGLLPALSGTRLDLIRVMRGERARQARPGPARGSLIAIQVAASAFLLVGASLFLRATLRDVESTPLRADAVVVDGVKDHHRAAAVAATATAPGVRGIAASWPNAPMMGEGRPVHVSSVERRREPITFRMVSAGYLEVYGIVLRRGRAFTDAETASRAPVALVSESMARRFWPNGDAIGQRLQLDFPPDAFRPGDPSMTARGVTIVGVTADVGPFRVMPAEAPLYLTGDATMAKATIAARVEGDVESMRRLLHERVVAIDPGVPLVVSTRSIQALETYPIQVAFWATAILGGLALLLTVSGIVGVVSFLVAQRVREFGIRAALGASAGAIVRLVVWQSMRPAVGGLAIGLLLAWTVAAMVLAIPGAALIGRLVDVLDPAAYLAGIGLVSMASVGAALMPTLRGARADPMTALRDE
jgi:predicted permease